MDYYKKLYIVDASVIIKWFTIENLREAALKLKKDFIEEKIELGIPHLALYETMNFITRKYPNDSTLIFSQLIMLKIDEFSVTLGNIAKTIEITQEFPKTTFYDTTYHALAIQNDGTLLTADEKYYNQAKSLKHIQLLKDYK